MTELPSKTDILDWIAAHPEASNKRDIARAFNLRGHARVDLKALLRELEDEGHLTKRKRRYRDPDRLPPVTVLAVQPPDADGDLFAKPLEWHGEGEPPKVLLSLRHSDPALGSGDRILAKLQAVRGEPFHYIARLIRKIGSNPKRLLGVFRKTAEGGRLVPVSKGSGESWVIPADGVMGAKDGELVEAETTGPRGRAGRLRVVARLGDALAPKAISLIAIHEHGLRDSFPDAVIAEAERAKPAGLAGREDLRQLPLITIDPKDARDHDDAILAEPDDDPANPGGFRLTVAIADVAHYVRPGSPLDDEAKLRGNSAYFPDRVVPMLPERLSADLCSLQPGVARPCMAILIRITADGRKLDHRVTRGLMKSHVSLTYEEAQALHDGTGKPEHAALHEPIIAPLFAAYHALMKARAYRAPLELDLPERDIILSDAGKVTSVAFRERLDAHRLVEEFMVLANVCAAESLAAKRAPALLRAHEEPKQDRLDSLREVAEGAGLALPKGVSHTKDLNRLLDQAAGSPSAELVNMSVLRAMTQAYYTANTIGHFGLSLRLYTHFTSPIRRYCDLVAHRALIAALGLGEDGQAWDDREALEALGRHISETERRAMTAERDTVDRYLAAFMAERVGEVLKGRISGVARFGAFVRLDESGGEGLVPIRSLGGEYFHHDADRHTLSGADSGRQIAMGDAVEVRICEASPITGGVEMELVSHEGKGLSRSPNARPFRPKGAKGPKRIKPKRQGKPAHKRR